MLAEIYTSNNAVGYKIIRVRDHDCFAFIILFQKGFAIFCPNIFELVLLFILKAIVEYLVVFFS